MMVISPKFSWTRSMVVASVGGLSLLLILASRLLLFDVFGPTTHCFLQEEHVIVENSEAFNGEEQKGSLFYASSPSAIVGDDLRGTSSVTHDGGLISESPPPPAPPNNSVDSDLGSCDLYQGKWIYDHAGPLYTNNSCPVLTQSQNCQGNGRPDKDYENWRWKPNQCVLPRFDTRKFLEMMRGKTLAFVGDSIARNQMESLLCILWQVETPQNHGNRQMHRWFFRSTSFTIVRIWSSWLVHKTSAPLQYAPKGVVKVHLDTPDESVMDHLPKFDVVVLSSGHWFDKQTLYVLNGTIVGGRQRKRNRKAKVNNVQAFGMSIETALTGIATHPNYTGLTILRTYTPDHYEGGAWNTGGSCSGITSPSDELVRKGYTVLMHDKQIESFKEVGRKLRNGSKMKMMDITEVSGYRHDGHPGQYRRPNGQEAMASRRNRAQDCLHWCMPGPNGQEAMASRRNRAQDCLHWCMPGPVDTWNEIMFEIIRREFVEG